MLDSTQAHPDAPHQIDGADIGTVVFIGQVRNISSQSTNTTYKIDDGTGEVEVKMWTEVGASASGGGGDENDEMDGMDVDGANSKQKKPTIVLNGFVKSFGKIKAFGNKKYVSASFIRPMTDINEFHCHLLEATAVHLFFARGPPPSKNGTSTGVGAGTVGSASGVTFDEGGDGAGAGGRPLLRMSQTARKIYSLLKSEPQSNEGLHMQLIASKLSMPVPEVAKGGDELVTAGVIFSTVDEYTWAILEY
jgi:replication factor A2